MCIRDRLSSDGIHLYADASRRRATTATAVAQPAVNQNVVSDAAGPLAYRFIGSAPRRVFRTRDHVWPSLRITSSRGPMPVSTPVGIPVLSGDRDRGLPLETPPLRLPTPTGTLSYAARCGRPRHCLRKVGYGHQREPRRLRNKIPLRRTCVQQFGQRPRRNSSQRGPCGWSLVS